MDSNGGLSPSFITSKLQNDNERIDLNKNWCDSALIGNCSQGNLEYRCQRETLFLSNGVNLFNHSLFGFLWQARGKILEPSEDLLIGIATGMAYIEIYTRQFVTKEMKGQVTFARNECNKIEKRGSNSFIQRSLTGTDLNVGVCLHQGRFFDHGDQWHPMDREGKAKLYCTRCKCHVSW